MTLVIISISWRFIRLSTATSIDRNQQGAETIETKLSIAEILRKHAYVYYIRQGHHRSKLNDRNEQYFQLIQKEQTMNTKLQANIEQKETIAREQCEKEPLAHVLVDEILDDISAGTVSMQDFHFVTVVNKSSPKLLMP